MTTQQPREHLVPCRRCRLPTWNVSAFCDQHEPDRVDETDTEAGPGGRAPTGEWFEEDR